MIIQDLLFTKTISYDRLIPMAVDDINNSLEMIERLIIDPKLELKPTAPLLQYLTDGDIAIDTAINVSQRILRPILSSTLRHFDYGTRVELVKQIAAADNDEIRDILLRTYRVREAPRHIPTDVASNATVQLMVNFYETLYKLRRPKPWKDRITDIRGRS